ncbi:MULTISPECIES: hypothetical protein [unclassified Pedobacter]|uniref:hypothetical protein n=1 Tax=unclassified Pedobacter TaxID=2628915 RepID=UPI001DF26612|nr:MULTISPECIES: hypothetical protein [unclassified Pedobacter]CAH0165686.1 hypothetical protein SRABI126_00898 [Pedobacter sp. Bi126]CAH0284287.1 hypothetical protein SRABI36_04110 [Pedobacter sp. Bi36]
MMQYLKVFVVFLLVLCGVLEASADGCALNYATANEVIYYGVLGGTRNFGSPVAYNNANPAYQTACPKYDYNSAVENGLSCRINGVINSSFRYIPTFTFIACPIDDYLPWLFVFGGFAAVLVIRSRANVNAFNL